MGFDWDQVVTREIGGGRLWDTSCCHDHHQDYRDDQNLDYHEDYLEDFDDDHEDNNEYYHETDQDKIPGHHSD